MLDFIKYKYNFSIVNKKDSVCSYLNYQFLSVILYTVNCQIMCSLMEMQIFLISNYSEYSQILVLVS